MILMTNIQNNGQKSKKKVLAVILARTGSRRLKNKLFKKVGNNYVLKIFLQRLTKSKYITDFIIATTKDKRDDKIVRVAKKFNFEFFRGSKNDVFNRFYNAIIKVNKNPDLIIRANADNFLVMPTILDKDIKQMLKKDNKWDLSSPFSKNFCPFGYSLVIFKKKTISTLKKKIKKRRHKEHIENYCFENERKFKILRPKYEKSLKYQNLKLSLDTKKDLSLMRFIFKKISKIKIDQQPKFVINLMRKNV